MPKKNFINDATSEPFLSARFYDKFEGGGIPYTGDIFDEDTGSATGLDEDKWDPFGTQGITPTWQPNYCRMQTNNDGAGAYGTTYLDSEYNFTGDFEFSFLMRYSSGQTTQHSLFLYAYDGGGNSGMYIQLSDVNNMYVETLNGGWVNQGALSGTAGSMFSLDTTVTMKRVGRDLTITVSNASGTSTKTVVDAISVGEATVPWKIRVSLSNWFTQDTNYRETFYRVDDYSIISGETDLPTNAETPTGNWWSIVDTTGQTIQVLNDKLEITTPNSSVPSVYALSEFILKGDFDIQVDFDTLSIPSALQDMGMRIAFEGGGAKQVGIVNNGGLKWNSHDGTQTDASGVTSGTIKLVRIGDQLTSYQDSTELGSDETVSNDDVAISISMYPNSGNAATVNYTNFVINSADKIEWPGGTLKAWVPQDGTVFLEEFNNYHSHWNGQPGYPRNSYWAQYGDTTSTILNDKLRVVRVASTAGQGIGSKFHFPGEFTIITDFDVIAQAGGNLFTCGISIENLGYTDGFFAGYYNTAGNPHTWCTSDLYSAVYTPIGSNDSTTTGKVRMVRDGADLITASGWDGTAWVPIGSQTVTGTVEAGVYIVAQSAVGTGTVDFDNFSVTADSVTWNDAGNWTPSRMNNSIEEFVPVSWGTNDGTTSTFTGWSLPYAENLDRDLIIVNDATLQIDIDYPQGAGTPNFDALMHYDTPASIKVDPGEDFDFAVNVTVDPITPRGVNSITSYWDVQRQSTPYNRLGWIMSMNASNPDEKIGLTATNHAEGSAIAIYAPDGTHNTYSVRIKSSGGVVTWYYKWFHNDPWTEVTTGGTAPHAALGMLNSFTRTAAAYPHFRATFENFSADTTLVWEDRILKTHISGDFEYTGNTQ